MPFCFRVRKKARKRIRSKPGLTEHSQMGDSYNKDFSDYCSLAEKVLDRAIRDYLKYNPKGRNSHLWNSADKWLREEGADKQDGELDVFDILQIDGDKLMFQLNRYRDMGRRSITKLEFSNMLNNSMLGEEAA